MSRKREQRLRRKARAKLNKVEHERDAALKLRRIALRAIRYVGEMDAPNPHEPWAVANRRDELRDEVHAHQGKSVRGVRRDQEVVRPAPVVPLRPLLAPVSARSQRARRVVRFISREQLVRDIEVKRAELRNAAKRLGAEANKRRRDALRVVELEQALDVAAKAFAAAVTRLNNEGDRAAREAMGEVAS